MKRGDRPEISDTGEIIVDEEEFRFMKELQQVKRGYRSQVSSLQEVRMHMEGVSREVDQARRSLLELFEGWLNKASSVGLGRNII